jgi:hypothetical protein
MNKITLTQFTELKKSRRNKIGVADKLDAFLKSNIASFAKDAAYVIGAQDFLGKGIESFHYYTALKMLNAQYADKLDWAFNLSKLGRADKVTVAVK